MPDTDLAATTPWAPRRTVQGAARGRALFVLCLFSALACVHHGDGADAQRAAARDAAARAAAMAAAARSTPRGHDLAGAELSAELSDRTWVSRYGTYPDGRRGAFVEYRAFRPDGRLEVTDSYVHRRVEPGNGDTWRVDGARLCLFHHGFDPTGEHCYRVARTGKGVLQVYVDEPGSPYDRGLTFVVSEILAGPAPVLEEPRPR